MKDLKYYFEIEQKSTEWHELRDLKLTASNATAIGANGTGLKTYIKKLVLRHINRGKDVADFYSNSDIERGNEYEPIAITSYEFIKGVDVQPVGFIEVNENLGFSPDGLVNEDPEGKGLVEVKARNDENHFALLAGDPVASGVRNQMQMQMKLSKRNWCDFISYNPNFVQHTFIKRFYPDPKYYLKLDTGIASGTSMLKSYLSNSNIIKEIL